jgi:hypothetical protein
MVWQVLPCGERDYLSQSLQDGSQDRSHSLRLRKRRQDHRGIWHVLTTLVTRWYVEPTLDLFSTSHSPSASSENKTRVRTTLLEGTHHDSRISTMRVTRQTHESNTCAVGLWAIPNPLDGPSFAPCYASYCTASNRHQYALQRSNTQQVLQSRSEMLLVLALICLLCLKVKSPPVISSDVHSMVHELAAICSRLQRPRYIYCSQFRYMYSDCPTLSSTTITTA